MVKRPVAALLERQLHRTIRQGREEGVNLVDQTVTQPPPGFGVEVEAHRHSI